MSQSEVDAVPGASLASGTFDRNAFIEGTVSKLMAKEMPLSYSALSAFKKSPRDFIDYKLGVKEQTDAMLYGQMVHCLVLEPDSFDNRYAVAPACDRRTKDGKETWANFCDSVVGLTIVSADDYTNAQIVSRNVLYNRASSKVLDLCPEREAKCEWEYKNFLFHGFKDGRGDKAIFDLKTCADAEPGKFQRDIINMGYYLQAAMYLTSEGAIKPYYIIAVDKRGGVSVHKLHKHLIEYGLEQYNRLMDAFNKCIFEEQFNYNYDFYAESYDGIFTAEKPGYLY